MSCCLDFNRALCEFPSCFCRPAAVVLRELYPRFCACHISELIPPASAPEKAPPTVATILGRQGPNNCGIMPSFGWPTSEVAIFCRSHAEADMVNVKRYAPSSLPHVLPRKGSLTRVLRSAQGKLPIIREEAAPQSSKVQEDTDVDFSGYSCASGLDVKAYRVPDADTLCAEGQRNCAIAEAANLPHRQEYPQSPDFLRFCKS